MSDRIPTFADVCNAIADGSILGNTRWFYVHGECI